MELILLIAAVVVILGVFVGFWKMFANLASFAGIGFKIIVWLVLIAIIIALGKNVILPMLLK